MLPSAYPFIGLSSISIYLSLYHLSFIYLYLSNLPKHSLVPLLVHQFDQARERLMTALGSLRKRSPDENIKGGLKELSN